MRCTNTKITLQNYPQQIFINMKIQIIQIIKQISSKNSSSFFIFCITTIFLLLHLSQAQLTIGSKTISTATNYTITLTQYSTFVPAGSIVQLVLPFQYSADDLHNAVIVGNQYDGYCPIDCTTVAVSYKGYLFNITGLWSITGRIFFQYTITGIVNPRSAVTVNQILIRVLHPTTLASLYLQTVPAVTFTPKTMVCTATVIDFTAVGFSSTAYVTLAPITNPRDQPMKYISIIFPSNWLNQPISTTTITTSPYCISTNQPNLLCSLSSNILTISGSTFTSSINIQIHSIYSPTSIMNASQITINTLTSARYSLDSCTIGISGFKQDYLRIPTLTITYVSDTILRMRMSATFPSLVANGTIVYFTVPGSVSLQGSNCSAYLSSFFLDFVIPLYYSANNTVSIDPIADLKFQPNVQIQCDNIIRPRAAITISNISIYSMYNGYYMAGITCCSTVLQARKSLNIISIVTDKPFLQMSNAQYVIKMSITISLYANDIIFVYFPKQYNLGSGSFPCTITSPTAVIGSPVCTVSPGNIVKIISFLSATATSGTQFVLSLNAIQNPTADPSTTPFYIYTTDASQNIIQSNTNQFVNISAALINTFNVTATNTQTLYSPSQYTFQFITNGLILMGFSIIINLPTQISVSLSSLSCKVAGIIYNCWYRTSSNSIAIRISDNLLNNTVTTIINGFINPQSTNTTSTFSLQILDTQQNKIQISTPNAPLTMTSPAQFVQLYFSMAQNPVTSVYSNIYKRNTLKLILNIPTKIKSKHVLTIVYNKSQIMLNGGGNSSTCIVGYNCIIDTVNGIVNVNTMNGSYGSDTIYLNITNVIPLVSSPTFSVTLKINSYAVVAGSQVVTPSIPDLITYTLTQTSYLLTSNTDITISYSLNYLSTLGVSFVNSRLSYITVSIPTQYTTSLPSNKYNTTTNVSSSGILTIQSITNPNYTNMQTQYFYIAAYSTTNDLLAISVNNYKFSLSCTLPCRTCSGTASNCQTCYSWYTMNLFYKNSSSNTSTCLSTCPRLFYLNTTTLACLSCDDNCLQCASTVGTSCKSCNSGIYLHEVDYKCYSVCPGGYFGANQVCRNCPTSCLTCLNYTYCYTCVTGLYYYAHKCITSCPPKTYSVSTPNLACVDCPFSNCLTCTSTQCTLCIYSYYLNSGQCNNTCLLPLYPTWSGICATCQCGACSGYANNCTVCTVAKPHFYNNYCYSVCPMGFYSNASNRCLSCSSSCLTCTTSSICTLCKQSYAIMRYNTANISCISNSTCPTGTTLTLSSIGIPSCLACNSTCQVCNISTTFCTSCISGLNLFGGTCLAICPASYYPIEGICQKCISICVTCLASDPQNCTQCQANYFFLNSSCYSSCPPGTYANTITKSCPACNSLCLTCSNATNCTVCKPNYFLFNWFCYSSCPTTPVFYYQYNGQCIVCQPQCQNCSTSPVACTSCVSTEYLFNIVTKQCTFQCSVGYYKNERLCVGCQSPCKTCDTTYNACSSCLGQQYLYNGTCVTLCPVGFYGNSTSYICERCIFPCRICLQNQCLLCESFSYMYQKACVLKCPHDMPYQQPGYCSQCIGIGFCARCSTSSSTNAQICTKCVYPYVFFESTCLNSCPINYTAVQENSSYICKKSESYLQYLSMLQEYNKPILPPFLILGIYLIVGIIICIISYKKYRYTYYVGFMLGFISICDAIFTYYSIYYIYTRYQGNYIHQNIILPSLLLGLSGIYNYWILSIIYWYIVIKKVYLCDIRYQQWKQRNRVYWWFSTTLIPFFGGPKLSKINYSKLFGLDRFAYRIVSVQKFYCQDCIIYFSAIGDILTLSAMLLCGYNIFVGYNGITFLVYQCYTMKIIIWILILYDMKKPDRGFFIGDEQQAQQQIKLQAEEESKKLNRIDTENFAKLVRTKSAYVLTNPKQFKVDTDDFISVYNPQDYQQVVKVPSKKIEKNIYKGKFRKGRKITIQQKLKKFVDSIKPRPVINKKKVDSYVHKLIYWKPPQMKKKVVPTQVILPPSQQSMLQLLQKKQLQYKQQLDDIQLVEQQKMPRKYFVQPRYNQTTFLDDIDQTIPNQTVQFFYPSHSIDTNQKQNSIDFDDLMNLNYARKKHLKIQEPNQKNIQQSKRKLHHQPQKKRKNMNIFGEMVLKKQY